MFRSTLRAFCRHCPGRRKVGAPASGPGCLIESIESRKLLAAAVEVNLSSAFNRIGIVADHSSFSSGGLNGHGFALSSALMGASQTWNGNRFAIAPAGTKDDISAAGQIIALPESSSASLSLLATGVYGNQTSQRFTVRYTDNSTQVFTQSISDWAEPQNYAGESTAITMDYRDYKNGTEQSGPWRVYGYSFALHSSKTPKSIELPDDSNLEVLSIDMTPAGEAPSVPTHLSVTASTATSISLQWTASTDSVGIAGYSIYRNGAFAGSVSGSTTRFTDSGLLASTTYIYDVTAIDTAGNVSAASATLDASTAQSRQPTAPNIPGTWNLSFNANFNSLDPGIWTNGKYWWGGNAGTQATFEPSAVTTSNGVLSITATRQSATASTGTTNPYTSGLISTGGVQGVTSPGFSFTYGYVQCNTKIAAGQGMWSALWMLPVSHQDNYELDAFELLGRLPTTFQGFDHDWPNIGEKASANLTFNTTQGFHTYGVDWEPNFITWYVDGKAIATYTDTSVIPNQPMYLMLNLDVGGTWAGPLTSASPASSTWQVSSLEVWQHPGQTSTLG